MAEHRSDPDSSHESEVLPVSRTDMSSLRERGQKDSPSPQMRELVVVTGLSGAGKQSALRAFEDLGYYAVDNLPMGLVPQFAALIYSSRETTKAVLVVDAREGAIERFPQVLAEMRSKLSVHVVFLEASDQVLIRRYSETRRPHPSRTEELITASITAERTRMAVIRDVADVILDTSHFNVHELRAHIVGRFGRKDGSPSLALTTMSFGFRNGVPPEADLVFDVRFLPNPHFIPEFRPLTGLNTEVAEYVTSFPQTTEFLHRVSDLLLFLLPQFEKEGKSYLTVAFGCTGGQHRSVAITEYIRNFLTTSGYCPKVLHRDMPR